MKNVSVMIVEDSPVARELITNALNSDPRLRVICAVDSAEKALRLLPRLAPDVISMDICLPGMDGVEATRRIMAQRPTPVVVVAADRREAVSGSMEALRAGALTVVEKPTIESAEAYGAMASRLCEQFVNMSQVKVVRQRFIAEPPARQAPVLRADRRTVASVAEGRAIDVVAVVASTGGPAAVAQLLRSIGSDLAAPILVVQHMAGVFLAGYADWLASVSGLPVGLAENGREPRPGSVHIAPNGHHLTYREGHLRLVADAEGRGHVPSGDVLFRSLANLGPRALGVLLTGMGEDGAHGLAEMCRAGAHTIVQDRATSAVYGMPAAAVALGAASEQLPIGAMAGRIAELVRGERVGRETPGGNRSK